MTFQRLLRKYIYLVTCVVVKIATMYQYFPVRGHSFLPCDHDFAIIKREIRYDCVYSVMDYIEMIVNARKKNNTYQNWWPEYFKKNSTALGTQMKERFSLATYRYLTYT
ncbi:hypothetical protein PR048_011580, partial [Dryococelus australis]